MGVSGNTRSKVNWPPQRGLVKAVIETHFSFCLTGNTSIRVPHQTKRRPDVIKFDTTKETHVKGVVATLVQLYRGEPVGSVQIGASYGMSHHQVLIYLHAAREDNLATPVYSNAGGIIAA